MGDQLLNHTAKVVMITQAAAGLTTAEKPLNTLGAELGHICVLIAHDDAVISAGLAATLGQQGFNVVMQAPESTVMQMTASNCPTVDVAIADYESGLRLIGSQGWWRERVIILTDRDSQASICRALERGVRGYLLLGCSLPDLISGIRLVYRGGTALGPLVATRIAERLTQRALTRREDEVLRLIMAGLRNKTIAAKLFLRHGTVKVHVKSIFAKLGAVSRTHAVAIARRRGILPEEGDRSGASEPVIGGEGHSRFTTSSRGLLHG